MPSSDSSSDALLERLAEEFVERHRRGERPALSEYAGRHPDLAAEIRDLFPALLQIEHLKPVAGDLTGGFVPEDGRADGHTPERLGDYRIVREVGRGGMGVVYEAEQESLGRHVALKVLPASALLNPTYLERFRREAKAAARLHHTNIVPVFGVGAAEGVHFYAMQFIRGEGLDKVLADVRRLRLQAGADPPATVAAEGSIAHSLLTGQFAAPAPEAPGGPMERPATSGTSGLSVGGPEADYCRGVARVGVQVAEALAYAHRQGILHRDIKPSNLLLDAQGTVWITDFGLAKAEGADELTHTGDIVGTIRFMAPERFEGQSLPQGDVYSLGATLYELLTLRPAFDHTNKAKLLDKVVHEPPVPPRKLDPHIPRDLETVVLKCLAKEPRGRYATAEAVADDLKRFLADRPIKARRAPAREHLWRWCRRNPALATLSGTLLLLLVVIAAGGVSLSLQLTSALGQAETDRDKARAAVRDGKRNLFESLVKDAEARRFSGRVGQRFGTLASVRKAAALARELGMPPERFDQLRNLAIAALALPDMHLVKEWKDWPQGDRGLAFDDRLMHYARGEAQGNITVRQVADDVAIASKSGVGPHVRIGGFDEGGRALVLLDPVAQARSRWRFAGNEEVSLGKHPALFAEECSAITTADQKLLAALNRKTGVVGVHDPATGKHLHVIRFGKWAAAPAVVSEFSWDMHPWKHELAIWLGTWGDRERQVVRILDLDQGKVQAELVMNPRMQTHGQLSWHPDGRTLAVAYAQVVVLWDVPSGRPFRVIDEHKGGGLAVSMSRSGQLMSTYSGWAEGAKFWHPHTGKLLLNLPGMRVHPTAPAPDGRMFAHRFEGTRLQLWATEPSPVLRVLVRGPARGRLVGRYDDNSIHRGGRLLATGSSQGVSLFDLSRGVDVGHLDLGPASGKFDPSSGDLLTYGPHGLLRWPVHLGPGSGNSIKVGPPQRLWSVFTGRGFDVGFDVSRDGKVIAIAAYQRALVLAPGSGKPPVILQPLIDCRRLAVSPDGRWVATGHHGGGAPDARAEVWDARTGERVKKLPLSDWSQVCFSPDGQWLFAKNDMGKARFWRVGTWEEGIAAPPSQYLGIPGFDPRGRLVAYERGEGTLQLVDSASGRQLAGLENPDQGRFGNSAFTPDGTVLVATNMDTPAIYVWDLRELRKHLAESELDWPGEAYPPRNTNRPAALSLRPLDVKIDMGKLPRFGK
jgi:serine/threonine protein kinase/WD40 repeat protein